MKQTNWTQRLNRKSINTPLLLRNCASKNSLKPLFKVNAQTKISLSESVFVQFIKHLGPICLDNKKGITYFHARFFFHERSAVDRYRYRYIGSYPGRWGRILRGRRRGHWSRALRFVCRQTPSIGLHAPILFFDMSSNLFVLFLPLIGPPGGAVRILFGRPH